MIPTNAHDLLKILYQEQRKYIMEEKAKIEKEEEISKYLESSKELANIFSSLEIPIEAKKGDILTSIYELRKISDYDAFFYDISFQEAQKNGVLQIILVPFWDRDVINTSESHLESILEILNAATSSGTLRRPLHIVIFLPRLSRSDIIELTDQWALYVALRKYFDVLSQKELEIMNEMDKVENEIIERKTILQISKKRKLKRLQQLKQDLQKTFEEEKGRTRDQILNLCKEIVSRILIFYDTVIYYDLRSNQFTTMEIHDLQEIFEKINAHESIDFADYLPFIAQFFSLAVKRIGFETNTSKIIDALLQQYSNHFALGLRSAEFDVYNVIENFMRGAYGVRPLSLNIVRRALKRLNNTTFSVDSTRVKASLDVGAGILRLAGERAFEESEEIYGEEHSLEELKEPEKVSIDLPGDAAVDDVLFKIEEIIRRANPKSLGICTNIKNTRLSVTLESPKLEDVSHLREILNPLTSLSKKAKANIQIEFEISDEIDHENIEQILEGKPLVKKTTFDEFLPP